MVLLIKLCKEKKIKKIHREVTSRRKKRKGEGDHVALDKGAHDANGFLSRRKWQEFVLTHVVSAKALPRFLSSTFVSSSLWPIGAQSPRLVLLLSSLLAKSPMATTAVNLMPHSPPEAKPEPVALRLSPASRDRTAYGAEQLATTAPTKGWE
jgi:hypothetical protein